MPRPRRAKKLTPNIHLRGRIWIEAGGPAITDAGADLLEQIKAWGSLSEAARRLRFSYRRAWMLVDTMNRRWPTPLVKLSAGGKRGGGATLTEEGEKLLRSYRDLQIRLQQLLDEFTAELRMGRR